MAQKDKNPYVLWNMNRKDKTSFEVTFFNDNFGQCRFIYKYGPEERINFYNEDMTEVTVNIATWLRNAMNHVFEGE